MIFSVETVPQKIESIERSRRWGESKVDHVWHKRQKSTFPRWPRLGIKMTSRDGHYLFAWCLPSLFVSPRIFLFPFSQEPARSSRIDSFPFFPYVHKLHAKWIAFYPRFPKRNSYLSILSSKVVSRSHVCHRTRTREMMWSGLRCNSRNHLSPLPSLAIKSLWSCRLYFVPNYYI